MAKWPSRRRSRLLASRRACRHQVPVRALGPPACVPPAPPILGLWCTEGLGRELLTSLDTPHAAVCNPDRGLRWRGFVSICHLVGLPFPQPLSIRSAPASGSQGPGRELGWGLVRLWSEEEGVLVTSLGDLPLSTEAPGRGGPGAGRWDSWWGLNPPCSFHLQGPRGLLGPKGPPGPPGPPVSALCVSVPSLPSRPHWPACGPLGPGGSSPL